MECPKWAVSCLSLSLLFSQGLASWVRTHQTLQPNPVAKAHSHETPELSVCVGGCSAHGVCEDFECKCQKGWAPPDCSLRTCDNQDNCGHSCCVHGECFNGHCYCDLLWGGDRCDAPTCANNCTNHGTCKLGVCECSEHFTGVDCSIPVCPSGCSGHGRCKMRMGGHSLIQPPHCQCDPGWTGEGCSVRDCTRGCSGHGLCVPVGATRMECQCLGGFAGPDCSENRCPSDCSSDKKLGRCDAKGSCHCAFGRAMPDCAEPIMCNEACFAHGHCENNQCVCDEGYEGLNCLEETQKPQSLDIFATPKMAPRPHFYSTHHDNCVEPAFRGKQKAVPPEHICSGHGFCGGNLTSCQCDPLYYGTLCENAVCPGVEHCQGECCGHGTCNPQTGACMCEQGFEGPDCFFRTCKNGCSGHGVCNPEGMCDCIGLWQGEDCSEQACLHDCSQHGRCEAGVCHCGHMHRGLDCSLAACPVHPVTKKVCSGVGYCSIEGDCICPDQSKKLGTHVLGTACELIKDRHDHSAASPVPASNSPFTVGSLTAVAIPCARTCMTLCMEKSHASTNSSQSEWSVCYNECNSACITRCWQNSDNCE